MSLYLEVMTISTRPDAGISSVCWLSDRRYVRKYTAKVSFTHAEIIAIRHIPEGQIPEDAARS